MLRRICRKYSQSFFVSVYFGFTAPSGPSVYGSSAASLPSSGCSTAAISPLPSAASSPPDQPQSSRNPTIKIRSRCCGTKCAASIHPPGNPIAQLLFQRLAGSHEMSAAIVIYQVLHVFEQKRPAAVSPQESAPHRKNSVPCVAHANPCGRPSAFFLLTPAIENGWQGKPATSTS